MLANTKNNIKGIRKSIANVNVVTQCNKENTFSKHQRNLQNHLQKKFGNTKKFTIESKLAILKQEMRISERPKINKLFANNPKKLYRSVKGNKIEVEKLPEKEEEKAFWDDDAQFSKILHQRYLD